MTADDKGRAPLRVGDRTYWLSHHAAQRALEMGVPVKIIEHILAHGTRYEAPAGSKYRNAEVFRMGRVAVAVHYNADHAVVASVLWATVEAWREVQSRAGREWRGDDWTSHVLSKWFGDDIHDKKAIKASPTS